MNRKKALVAVIISVLTGSLAAGMQPVEVTRADPFTYPLLLS